MQRRRQHGSSGELDVFGATRYFDGLATAARPVAPVVKRELRPEEDRIIQVNTTAPYDDDKRTVESHRAQLAGDKQTTNKQSKISAFLGSLLVSPEGTMSFRKKPPPLPSPPPAAASSGTAPTSSTSTSSSRTTSSEVVVVAHRGGGCGHEDLCVAMWEDRRLRGVRVVRGGAGAGAGDGGCDEERWVVRCGASSAWEEHQHHGHQEIMVGAATSRSYGYLQVQGGDQDDVGDRGSGWESDSSSDLFELNLEST